MCLQKFKRCLRAALARSRILSMPDNGLRQLNPNTIFIIFVLVEVSFKISLIRISMRTDRTTKQEWGTLRQIFGEGWENLGCHYI